MQAYVAGKDVTVTVPLVAEDGTPLSVSAVSYRVLDTDAAVLIDWTALATFVAESTEADILVPAASNQTPAGDARALRIVEIQATVDGNVVPLQVAYIIQSGDVLQVGVNTFQTLEAADFVADLIPNLAGWDKASAAQKTAALIEARLHICQLNFQPLNGNKFWGQDSLNFIPEGSFATPFAAVEGSFIWGGNLLLLPANQFNLLPPQFVTDLKRAQILEANAILGGDPADDKRTAGIQLDTAGDAKVMFRAGKALQLPVCRRAASALGLWLTWRTKLGRC
jgi:hypothetical protein